MYDVEGAKYRHVDDEFEFVELSKQILDTILLKMRTPNVFGIYGNWGSGKSTLVHFILEHISKDEAKEYGYIKYFKFDAWKYEYSEHNDVLYAMIDEMKDEFKVPGEGILKNLSVIAGVALSGAYSLLGAPKISEINEEGEKLEKLAYEANSIWINNIKNTKAEFKNFISSILGKENQKLFIFIDDLDRCKPDNTIRIIEAIKNFLDVENVIFILPIDRRVVSKMISNEFGMLESYGEEYLMKIIPHFYEMVSNSNLIDVKRKFSDLGIIVEDERVIAFIKQFLKDFFPEPRVAKFFLNQFCIIYNLNKSFREAIEKDDNPASFSYGFVACALKVKFPFIFKSKVGQDLNNFLALIWDASRNRRHPKYDNLIKGLDVNPYNRKILEEIFARTIPYDDKATWPHNGVNHSRICNFLRKIND